MTRKIETEFAFDIGDVVRLKAWNYTVERAWGIGPEYVPESPSCVYKIVELLAIVCEGGLQREYSARPVSSAGNCTRELFTFSESELELATPLPRRPPEKPVNAQ